MIFIEESKTGQLIPYKVGERIASILLEEFLDSIDCVKKNIVWWSFEMKDLVGKVSRSMYI